LDIAAHEWEDETIDNCNRKRKSLSNGADERGNDEKSSSIKTSSIYDEHRGSIIIASQRGNEATIEVRTNVKWASMTLTLGAA
jgi:hypothetical protein